MTTETKTEPTETTPTKKNNDLSSKERKKGKSLWSHLKMISKVAFVIFGFISIGSTWYLFKQIDGWRVIISEEEIYAIRADLLTIPKKVANKIGVLSPNERRQNVIKIFELTKGPSNGLIHYYEGLWPDGELYTESVFIKDGLRYTVKHNKWNFNTPLHIFIRKDGTTGKESLTSLHYGKEGMCYFVKLPSGITYSPVKETFDIGIMDAQNRCDKTLLLVSNYLNENKKG